MWTRFSYLPEYLKSGRPAVAFSLPLSAEPVVTGSGSVPPFFTDLLPEGRRLSSLRRAVKASADDELALLIAVGGDPVGDVQIMASGTNPVDAAPAVVFDPKSPVNFRDVLDGTEVDPSALGGVQEKVSAGMISVPVESAGRRFILKLDPPEYPHVVENEFLMYAYARRLKLPLSRLCHAPLPAMRNLAIQLVFAWLTGNGDLHAKNLSLLQDAQGRVAVAPVYDIPSIVVYGDRSWVPCRCRAGAHFTRWSLVPRSTPHRSGSTRARLRPVVVPEHQVNDAFHCQAFGGSDDGRLQPVLTLGGPLDP